MIMSPWCHVLQDRSELICKAKCGYTLHCAFKMFMQNGRIWQTISGKQYRMTKPYVVKSVNAEIYRGVCEKTV